LDDPSNLMNSRRIAIIVTLAGLSVATNYALISVPNVKLMDLIVFVSGFCFGPVVGALTGIVPWTIYGTLNPQGFSLPVWFATMFSESIYGLVGALVRRSVNPGEFRGSVSWRFNLGIFFGLVSVFLTFVYDLITNIVWGHFSNSNVMFSVVFGFATFGIVHMVSNAFFFGVGCVPAINALLKVVRSKNFDVPKK